MVEVPGIEYGAPRGVEARRFVSKFRHFGSADENRAGASETGKYAEGDAFVAGGRAQPQLGSPSPVAIISFAT